MTRIKQIVTDFYICVNPLYPRHPRSFGTNSYNCSKLRLINLLKASPFNNPLDNKAKSTI